MTNFEKLSDNLSRIAPSATTVVTQKARDLKAAGEDVISLSVGESDFDTPEHIIRAAIEALKQGKTRYTTIDGTPELKAAICRKFKRENSLNYSPAQINVSPGGKAVIYNALSASLNVGDEVIIPAPCWVSYPEIVKLCGAKPVTITCDMQSGFKLTPEQLSAAITPRTRWLILNSPSNPTGAAYSQAELRALADVLIHHPRVMILTDDIYENLVYDDFAFTTLAEVSPELYDRTLTMNGVSKTYAMTGWRIGYAGGPEWLISAMAKIMGQSTGNPASFSQYGAIAALDGPQDFIQSRNIDFRKRRDFVVKNLNAAGLVCKIPVGAFYVFASCASVIGKRSAGGALIKTDLDFCEHLLSESLVALVPGIAFHSPSFFRLSYATSLAQLEQACTRIAAFCNGCH